MSNNINFSSDRRLKPEFNKYAGLESISETLDPTESTLISKTWVGCGDLCSFVQKPID
jgi:hypothetical protein